MLWPLAGFGIGYLETTTLMMIEFFNSIAEGKACESDFRVGVQNCKVMDVMLKSAEKCERVEVE